MITALICLLYTKIGEYFKLLYFLFKYIALNEGAGKTVNFTLAPGSVASDLRHIANTTVKIKYEKIRRRRRERGKKVIHVSNCSLI